VLFTTPTITAYAFDCPTFTRFPTAACPGQNRRAKVSFTITVSGAIFQSAPSNPRPRTTGMPSVSKNSGDTTFWLTISGGASGFVSCPSI
jgi:hypothetical protein